MVSARVTPTVARRFAAFGLDYLLVSAYLVLLGSIGAALAFGPMSKSWVRFLSDPLHMDLVAFLTTVLPVGAYFAFFESSRRGATPGKRLMRLRVAQLGGARLSLRRAAIRAAAKLLPWQIAHTSMFHFPGWPANPHTPPLWVTAGLVLAWTLVGFYVLTIAFRSDRRAPYDWISGAQVLPDVPNGEQS